MDLFELNKKVVNELHLYEKKDKDEDEKDEDEEFIEKEKEENNNVRIRVENETKIRGLIKSVDFEFVYRDFADRVNEEVDGVVLTREKAHQVFDIVREMLGI